jgi:small nuclear ribonucleoprotein (snRNP)-like protein
VERWADAMQGFDEFMNLVIDDAVEVTLANAKKDTPEERRNVGRSTTLCLVPPANPV